MIFEKHLNLNGLHAPFSPSSPAWLRYDEDKLLKVFENKKASERGTRLHAWAKETIDLGIKQPRSKKTLYSYVNDCIGFRMSTEVVLFYSKYFFGTADAISFDGNTLRIHDLKTGISLVHDEQLKIYSALFCLEYHEDPRKIQFILQIYQNDEIIFVDYDDKKYSSINEEIEDIMNKIIEYNKILEKYDR